LLASRISMRRPRSISEKLFTSHGMAIRITVRRCKLASFVQWLSTDSAILASANARQFMTPVRIKRRRDDPSAVLVLLYEEALLKHHRSSNPSIRANVIPTFASVFPPDSPSFDSARHSQLLDAQFAEIKHALSDIVPRKGSYCGAARDRHLIRWVGPFLHVPSRSAFDHSFE
jgi:hypothetical protein